MEIVLPTDKIVEFLLCLYRDDGSASDFTITAAVNRIEQLQKIVDDIPRLVELVSQDCGKPYDEQPSIYQRGNKWRYHTVRAGNNWEDGDTPLAAVEHVQRPPV